MTHSHDLYITTAIDYVNATPHIGTAYEKIGADVLARFHRQRGRKVHLQMGNDEHSLNVAKSAAAAGLAPLAYCDAMEGKFTTVWKALDIAYDGFIRTTEPRHQKTVAEFFARIEKNHPDHLFKKRYTGWYCDSCEAYYTEKDLVDGQCPQHKSAPRWVEQDNWFFKLSAWEQPLRDYITTHPEFIQPVIRKNEIMSFINADAGLQDISISREGGTWGIRLPKDPTHTVYVWFDALINYISALESTAHPDPFARWNALAKNRGIVHVIGKDITRFHCVIWPAMLLAAGLELPTTIFGHGFVYFRGERMSKTLGNVVNPLELVQQYGCDPLRYFLLRENSFGADGNFTWEQFIDRYNGDLANGIGNLVSRTVGMVRQYLGDKVARCSLLVARNSSDTANTLRDAVTEATQKIQVALDYEKGDIQFHDALAAIWSVITAADKLINEAKPWALNKSGEKEKVAEVLANVCEAIHGVANLLAPFLPTTTAKILHAIDFKNNSGDLVALFPRIDTKESIVTNETSAVAAPIATTPPAPATPAPEGIALIDITDFAKIELRVATIVTAEKIAGADRLLKLQVDLGTEQRQIVAGIALHYTPEELIGKQVCAVTNLKPVKLRGTESHGMLLAASGADTVSLLMPMRPVPAGSKVK